MLLLMLVSRPVPGNTVSLTVDGRAIKGDVAPLPPNGEKEVEVKATLA